MMPGIAVVGGCASGKTTIVNELRKRGFDAFVVGQEHSGIARLWKHQEPDHVVFLDVTLDAVRERRGENWPAWLFRIQQERLQNAYEHASVHVNTATLSVEQAVEAILADLPGKNARDQESSSSSSSDGSL